MRTAYCLCFGMSLVLAACNVEGASRAPSELETAGELVEDKEVGTNEPTDAAPPCGGSTDACVGGAIDDGACVDLVDLKLLASNDLCAEGLSLSAFDIDLGDCPEGQARAAKYACCPTPPAPPDMPKDPPPADDPGGVPCEFVQYDVSACTLVSDLEAGAANTCATAGAALVDRKAWGDCPEGQATSMFFSCCATPP